MLLGRCEFNKDDYSLNIINMPSLDENPVDDFPEETAEEAAGKKHNNPKQASLFE